MAPEAWGCRVAATRPSLLCEGSADHGQFETVPAHFISATACSPRRTERSRRRSTRPSNGVPPRRRLTRRLLLGHEDDLLARIVRTIRTAAAFSWNLTSLHRTRGSSVSVK